MNKYLLIALLSSFGITCFAKMQTFSGSAEYTKDPTHQSAGMTTIEIPASFNTLEQAGVSLQAEIRALANCKRSGASDCVILGSQVVDCNNYLPGTVTAYCDSTGSARGDVN